MDTFGDVIARVIVDLIALTEGTLAHWVSMTNVSGNITNISLTAEGQAFCLNWSKLIVSFAGAMDDMMRAFLAMRFE